MFDGCTFLIIESNDIPKDECENLSQILMNYGAIKVYTKEEHDLSINYMSPPIITNIITSDCKINFIEYSDARTSMIPITTPKFVYDSTTTQKTQSFKHYNPDPSYFFKDLFVCCSDNLPDGDKELIYGAVKAFGGNYLDALTKYTTHLISQDLGNEKAIIASSIIENPNDDFHIKIVLPEWIDHCITLGKKVTEDSYILTDSTDVNELYKNLPPSSGSDLNHLQDDDQIPNFESTHECDKFIRGKQFFISSDFNLSQRLSRSITLLIEKFGGTVQSSFNIESLDIYLGKFRQGTHYKQASLNKNIVVGNLQWLYSIIVNKKWVLPVNSNILNYPIPPAPLNSFKKLKISISNYSGDSRKYLTKLISILGGTFTKTLSKENDLLICAKPEGKKYDAAKSKWINEYGISEISIVNHLWLEDCFVQWARLDESQMKFTNFGDSNLGMEPLIGRVHLNDKLLKAWYHDEGVYEPGMTSNIDDSMSEDECTQARKESSGLKNVLGSQNQNEENDWEKPENDEDTQFSSDSEQDESVQPQQLSQSKVSPSKDKPTSSQIRDVQKQASQFINSSPYKNETSDNIPTLSEEVQNPTSKSSQNKPMNEATTDSKTFENERTPDVTVSSQVISPSTPVDDNVLIEGEPVIYSRYGGRSAAKKAALKLHDNMSDLNEFQQMKHSNKKMQKYLDNLNKESDKKRKSTTEEDSKVSKFKKQFQIIAIMTGCESEIELTKKDSQRLKELGINILSDFDSSQPPNTLIAPKVLRTEKFLRSLSSVDKIIHPRYLMDLLQNQENQVNITDYNLQIIDPSTKSELDFEKISNGTMQGIVFKDLNFNLSANLNGGFEVVSRILSDHGVKNFKEIKISTKLKDCSNYVTSPTGDGERAILIANKTKDTKLINNFKKHVANSLILDWDFCIRSIFQMESNI